VLTGAALALSLSACAPKEKAEIPPVPPPPAAGAPAVTVATLDDLKDMPAPYDDKATPEQITGQIDAAYVRAGQSGKRVLVDMGGNWCVWCRGLAGVMHRPEVAPFIEKNFEVVYVDVTSKEGSTDLNKHTFSRFKLAKDPDHFPWVIVTEPDGTVLESSYEITDKGNETPQAWINWLARYAQTPTPTESKV
ncbi:MAG: thioredoxin family protein, partial [Alphaproteobacteria bacterium]